MSTAGTILNRAVDFIEQCRLEPGTWRFASSPGGPETLYASCFACMSLHYLGKLSALTAAERRSWADYLNSWQDPGSGCYLGPELTEGELHSGKHSYEHLAQHLSAHVLPALHLLGAGPAYPLTFAHPFLELGFLERWLEERDWHDAWLEGNNLLFAGQFLIHLRDFENRPEAQAALNFYFDWLDREQDPATGLWGTNGFCSNAVALYGGYHQLLVYYYEGRPVRYPRQLIDVALSLQHADGGFHPGGGGGACEDTDAIDILVNMYKLVDYRRPEIRAALRRALGHLLRMQMPDGGFAYRRGEPFIHMGMERTASAAGQSNLFPTWFRLHTLALIGEILVDEPALQWDWQFNRSCSMGWHRPWDKAEHRLDRRDRRMEQLALASSSLKRGVVESPRRLRRLGGRVKRRLLRSLSNA